MLPEEEDIENATLLADSLCQLLSSRGVESVQTLIQEGYANFLLNLEESLYSNATINGVELPELQDYRMKISEERIRSGPLFQFNRPSIKDLKIGRNDQGPCSRGKKYK